MILGKTVEELLIDNGEEVLVQYDKINKMHIRDFVLNPLHYYLGKSVSKEYLTKIKEKLEDYNLIMGMNEFDLELYKINPFSIFFTFKLENEFSNDNIYSRLKKRRKYTLSQLVLCEREELSCSYKYKGDIGFSQAIDKNRIKAIESYLAKNNLRLGMSKNEIIIYVKKEALVALSSKISQIIKRVGSLKNICDEEEKCKLEVLYSRVSALQKK